jgi:hypothetical protein
MDIKYQQFIGDALKTLQKNSKCGIDKDQRIKTDSFQGIFNYLNKSENWVRVSEGWKNVSGQLLITNSTKGFVLHRIH